MSLFSGIDESMAEANNQIFGDSALFRPLVGLSVSCIIDVERDVELQPDSYEATVVGRGVTVEARVAEVGSPKKGDVFELGTAYFTVRKTLENDGVWVTVVVHED